ncbi:MAG: Ig-like domain-containing protein [bacterium]|nr:Ig-like domain-containing protein [bacterium]
MIDKKEIITIVLLYYTLWITLTLIFLIIILSIISKILHPLNVKSIFTLSKIKSIFYSILNFISKRKILLISGLLLVALAVVLIIVINSPKIIFPRNPSFGTKNIDESHPIIFTFDRPVNSNEIKIQIKPPIAGITINRFQFNHGRMEHSFYFYPQITLPPDAEYSVTLSSAGGVFGLAKSKEYLFSLHTPPSPGITSILPKNGEENVDINQDIVVSFDFSDQYRTQWSFQLIPEVKLSIKKNGNKTIVVKPETPLQKGLTYQLKIFRIPIAYSFKSHKVIRRGESQEVGGSTFKTVVSPSVKSISPTGSGILVDTAIKIEFRQPMDTESVKKAWSISPVTSGNFTWEGDTNLTFIPTNVFTKNTQYKIILSQSASTKYGMPFESNYISQFTTIGPVTASFSPANSSSRIGLSKAIIATFNQEVDHESAEKNFSISPLVAGNFSWHGNIMTFQPSANYQYSTSYTASLSAGIKSTKGLDSNQTFSSKFTTIDQVVKLNIPFYKQEHYYTCGIVAARMALAFKGVNISEMGLLSEVGYDSTPLNTANNIWGNPDVGFVGTLMGSPKGTGYGVHWAPVAKAINYHRPAEIKQNWNVQGIATEIANGNPVVIWWVNGVWPSFERSWKTPDGTSIRAVNGMHAVVVNGFTGTVDNPKTFSVSDPWWPRKDYNIALFNSYWHWFGNTAIVVR